MNIYPEKLAYLKGQREQSPLQITTLGKFSVKVDGKTLDDQSWGREKALQLFQFLVTSRKRRAQHKEQIIARLWEDADGREGDRDYKVALHGIHKVLEPNRRPRESPRFIIRQGLTYHLDTNLCWIDADALELYVALGNETTDDHPDIAAESFREAIDLYKGSYLPDRLYEDWTSEERERLQVLALGTYVALAELWVSIHPMESVRLCQQALLIDPVWEDAYYVQIKAYLAKGNRPQAIRTYKQCEQILMDEFGIRPLPETRKLVESLL